MISEKSVQLVLDTARVEEVVEEYVNLKKRGANMIGLCPFHNEKTPSFSVSPAKNIYKCFGCGKGGNAVQFLMEHDSFSFPEAIRHLANKYQIELEETQYEDANREERQHRESLYLVNQYAESFFLKELLETDEGKSVGISYFRERGYLEDTIRKFGLGYSSNAKDKLTKSAVATGYNLDLLKKLRLTNDYGSDFFRERVMFTIHNLSGKPIAFAGRTLRSDKKIAKYVNSPESDLYIKSKVLYGIFHSKRSIRQLDECLLVEGYTDVISLHQSGIENVVASSGTSLTEEQIRLIKRFTPNIKILYDGDEAGIKAASRGLSLALAQDMNVRVVALPDGEDPDSYVRKIGSNDFKKYIEDNAHDFILFKTEQIKETTANDPIKKSKSVVELVELISLIPNSLKRSIYIKECSKRLDISENLFLDTTNTQVQTNLKKKLTDQRNKERRDKIKAEQQTVSEEEQGQTSQEDEQNSPLEKEVIKEREILRILLEGGTKQFAKDETINVAEFVLSNIADVMDQFEDPTCEKCIKIYKARLVKKENVSLSYFVNHPEKEIRNLVVDLTSTPYIYSQNWKERHGMDLRTQPDPEENFNDLSIKTVLLFKYEKIGRQINANKKEMIKLNGEMNPSMQHRIKLHQKLLEVRKEIAVQLKTVVME